MVVRGEREEKGGEVHSHCLEVLKISKRKGNRYLSLLFGYFKN